jgi:rare lipoprotein A
MRLLLLAWLLVLGGCGTLVQDEAAGPQPPAAATAGQEEPGAPEPAAVVLGEGVASWYGLPFHGRRTASGERFDMNAMTAAHPFLPFGTRVLVRNPANGRSVVVRINDRGPHVPGRIIDLSHAAARQLGLLSVGVQRVVLLRAQPADAAQAAD